MSKIKHPQFQKNIEIQKLKQQIERDDVSYHILKSRTERLESRLNQLYNSLIELIFNDNDEIYQILLEELNQTEITRIIEFRNKIQKHLTSNNTCDNISLSGGGLDERVKNKT